MESVPSSENEHSLLDSYDSYVGEGCSSSHCVKNRPFSLAWTGLRFWCRLYAWTQKSTGSWTGSRLLTLQRERSLTRSTLIEDFLIMMYSCISSISAGLRTQSLENFQSTERGYLERWEYDEFDEEACGRTEAQQP